jgi:hypothetical protein
MQQFKRVRAPLVMLFFCFGCSRQKDATHGDSGIDTDSGGVETSDDTGDTGCGVVTRSDLAAEAEEGASYSSPCDYFAGAFEAVGDDSVAVVAFAELDCPDLGADVGTVRVLEMSGMSQISAPTAADGQDNFGARVALGLGDGAGPDLLAVAWGADTADEGGVVLFDASNGSVLTSIEEPGFWIGLDVAFQDDYFLAAAPYDGQGGEVLVFPRVLGEAAGAADAVAVHHARLGDEAFGDEVAPVGDVDGDGLGDAVISSYYSDPVLVFGYDLIVDEGAQNGTPLLGVGLSSNDAVVGLEDVDGDGLRDFALGNGRSTYARLGHVEVRTAVSADPIAVLLDDQDARTDVSAAIGTIGDIDGDGWPELVVPAQRVRDTWDVYVIEAPFCGVLSLPEEAGRMDLGADCCSRMAAVPGGVAFLEYGGETDSYSVLAYGW